MAERETSGQDARDATGETPAPQSTGRSRLKCWAFRLAAVFLSLVMVALVCEVGLRIFHPQPTGFYGFDEYSLADGSPRPGASGLLCGVQVEINADAERGPAYPHEKPANTRRVCVLGDSIVFGLGVDEADRYPRVAERLLQARDRSAAIEVIPLGQVAYRLSGYRTRLLPKALAYEPDVVVVGFVLNDFELPPKNAATSQVVSSLQDGDGGGLLRGVKRSTARLRKYSHLVYFLRKHAQMLMFDHFMSREELVVSWELTSMYPDRADFKARWDYTVRQLDEIAATCASRSIPLVILMTPLDIQTSRARLEFCRARLPDLPDTCLDCLPQSMMAEYCRSRGIGFVDATGALRTDAQPTFFGMLEGRIDLCHPNAHGHEVIGGVLARALERVLGSRP